MRRQAPDMGEAARGARRVRAAAGHGRPRGRARGRAHRSRGCPSGSCRRCSASTRSAGRDSPGGELGGTIALTGPDVASFQGNVGARSGRRPHVRLDQGDRRSDPHKPAPAHRRPTRPTAARPGAAPRAQGDPARLRRQGAALQAHPPGSHATRDRTQPPQGVASAVDVRRRQGRAADRQPRRTRAVLRRCPDGHARASGCRGTRPLQPCTASARGAAGGIRRVI